MGYIYIFWYITIYIRIHVVICFIFWRRGTPSMAACMPAKPPSRRGSPMHAHACTYMLAEFI